MSNATFIEFGFRCAHLQSLYNFTTYVNVLSIQPPSTCDVFEDLPIYTLYITGTVNMASVPYLQHRSPVAILDRFEGTGDEIDAPEWVNEGEEHLRFYQPRGVFAELFANLALVDLNASQVCAPACGISLSSTDAS